jgi:two-component system OmpR family response regulator
MIKILMVEDDEELADIIQRYLLSKDILLHNVTNGANLLAELEKSSSLYDILILDLTLPDIDGLDLIKNIRQTSDIPIIISSARDDLLDKINGFDRGADDYLPKPYDPRELEARIKTILKRKPTKTKQKDELFVVNEDARTISFKGHILDLTQAQYDILALLIQRKNGIVSRDDMIYNSLYIDDDSSLKNIDVMISYIRKKINKIEKSNYIQSVRGMGYKLVIPNS